MWEQRYIFSVHSEIPVRQKVKWVFGKCVCIYKSCQEEYVLDQQLSLICYTVAPNASEEEDIWDKLLTYSLENSLANGQSL